MKFNLQTNPMPDWKVALEAEKDMKSIDQISEELGLKGDELIPMGRAMAKVDFEKVTKARKKKKDAYYIDVTAITPTPLGEGKTTSSMGLVEGLGKRGQSVIGAIRQPSMGPTFNIKGSAAGGGVSQCVPLTDFSLGLTGDFDCITNAHNLAMVALTSRMQHEYNYDDKMLKSKKLKRLDVDHRNVEMKWIIDFCAQSLRDIIIGLGGKMDGFMMQSGFAITVSSELMAILAVFKDLKDFVDRMNRIVVAYNKKGEPVTTGDLEVGGAMAALMLRALNPNLMQTVEGQPVLVHAGPFANIAIGQSSIVADRVGLKLADYHVTESGFGADIGFEKFWNLKCRFSGLKPHCAVLVATTRALKMHGGGPKVVPGRKLDPAYTSENVKLVQAGAESNLAHHIRTIKKAGINPVVVLNGFKDDTKKEVNAVKRVAEKAGANFAYSQHWAYGGEGALEFADAVMDACKKKSNFKFLYPETMPLSKRIETICKEVYGGKGVDYTPEARAKLERLEKDPEAKKLGTCMVKTHLSTTDVPGVVGAPKGWTLMVRDILTYKGAGFLVPVAGPIKLMPGTASDAAYRRIKVNTKSGKVEGMF
jgi:formyltetrahydrofolate synthetase